MTDSIREVIGMDYAWARDFTLELINQYSIAGDKVAMSYNNQSDYLNRIPKLLDDAQTLVATTARRIRVTAPLEGLDSVLQGQWRVCTLPEDCWQMSGAGLIRFAGQALQRFHKYHMIGDRQFALPEEMKGELWLEYFRYPKLLGASPRDNAELDNTTEVQMALPYYAASHLVMYDNAFAYSALYNEWEGKLERLYELPQTELNVVEDVYDETEWRGLECE